MLSQRAKQSRTRPLLLEALEARRLLSRLPTIDHTVTSSHPTVNASVTGSPAVSISTGEKPQSKVWEQAGNWFSVLPDNLGTWVRRLDGDRWINVLQLTSNTKAQADVKPAGDLVHVLLFEGTRSQLVTLEYVEGVTPTYQLWTVQPKIVDVVLSKGVETATIDLDSTGRMWLASDAETSMEVRYSDFPYTSFGVPVTIAANTTKDDICAIAALPSRQIGVVWSDQNGRVFGFRTHPDGGDPALWSLPAAIKGQSPKSPKGGFADDHINLVVAQDGTLYAAIKTSFDTRGVTQIGLLVRRPNGTWDSPYSVDTVGTRPIVVLNEATQRLAVIYSKSVNGGDIVYRESSMNLIAFGARKTLMKGTFNNATSARRTFGTDIVVMAGGKKTGTSRLPLPNP